MAYIYTVGPYSSRLATFTYIDVKKRSANAGRHKNRRVEMRSKRTYQDILFLKICRLSINLRNAADTREFVYAKEQRLLLRKRCFVKFQRFVSEN